MGPKVRAALAFADSGGRAVITSLERLREGVEGAAGTRVRGMTERVLVRRGAYHDSVTLMLVSRAAATATGDEVAVAHGDAAEPRAARRPGLHGSRTPARTTS